MNRHFTATVYIVQENKTLLLYHLKHKKWLPPGGHVEINETPAECARREALEETGLEIQLFKEEHLWVDYPNAKSSERPFMCLIEKVPAVGTEAAHEHIDFIFIGYPVKGELRSIQTQLRWFSLEEAMELQTDSQIFPDTQDTLHTIFTQFLCV